MALTARVAQFTWTLWELMRGGQEIPRANLYIYDGDTFQNRINTGGEQILKFRVLH
jgi:hypothetical protein